MEQKTIVKYLNKFLEGNYMAIHTYENYIKHIDNEEIKHIFQKIQQDHKNHAMKVAERIQNLGGVATHDVGLQGKMVEIVQNITGGTKQLHSIIKDAIAGERRGIEKSKEIVDENLDEESLQLVKSILATDENHTEQLENLLLTLTQPL